jgi:hypothetical protein
MRKVEKVRSTIPTLHDYLNFCGERKEDRLFFIRVLSLAIGENERSNSFKMKSS